MLILVPGVAVAASFTYNGLEGSSGNKANVTPAGQLLTTPVLPSHYQEFRTGSLTSSGGGGCSTLATIPSNDAFIIQQVTVDANQVDTPSSYTGPAGTSSNANFQLYLDLPTDIGACADYLVTSGDMTAPGNVETPIVPGYVVPSGYAVDIATQGISGTYYVSGYLVPKADAPSGPQTPRLTAGELTQIRKHRP
jgi:hypothetical protein